MYISFVLLICSLAVQLLAMPLAQSAAAEVQDFDVLTYALLFEYLEQNFYSQGLKNFTQQDFEAAGFENIYSNLEKSQADKQSYIVSLQKALGNKAFTEPTFAFPVKDVPSFMELASVLEGAGVSAYVGAVPAFANSAYQDLTGSILSDKAGRAYDLRAAVGKKPFPAGQFTPLGFRQGSSLASQIVTNFADGTKIPFQPFRSLTVAPNAKGYCAGGTVQINASLMNTSDKIYAVFYSGDQAYYVPTETANDVYTAKIPDAKTVQKDQLAPAGQVYIVLSTADGMKVKANDVDTLAGVGIIEITC